MMNIKTQGKKHDGGMQASGDGKMRRCQWCHLTSWRSYLPGVDASQGSEKVAEGCESDSTSSDSDNLQLSGPCKSRLFSSIHQTPHIISIICTPFL